MLRVSRNNRRAFESHLGYRYTRPFSRSTPASPAASIFDRESSERAHDIPGRALLSVARHVERSLFRTERRGSERRRLFSSRFRAQNARLTSDSGKLVYPGRMEGGGKRRRETSAGSRVCRVSRDETARDIIRGNSINKESAGYRRSAARRYIIYRLPFAVFRTRIANSRSGESGRTCANRLAGSALVSYYRYAKTCKEKKKRYGAHAVA